LTLGLILFLSVFILPVDYGISGVLMPVALYYFLFVMKKPEFAFLGMTILFAVFAFMNNGNLLQAFSILALPLILIASKYDNKIRIGKKFFYIFYPAHIALFLCVWILINFAATGNIELPHG